MLDEQRTVLRVKQVAQAALTAELDQLTRELEAHVAQAAPHQERLEAGLRRLDLTNLAELRVVTAPSDGLLAVVRAVAILLAPKGRSQLSQEALSWKELKKMFAKADQLLAALQRFSVRSEASPAAIHSVQDSFLSLPVMAPDPKDSPVVDGLKAWVTGVVHAYFVYEGIKPKQAVLNTKSKEIEQVPAWDMRRMGT